MQRAPRSQRKQKPILMLPSRPWRSFAVKNLDKLGWEQNRLQQHLPGLFGGQPFVDGIKFHAAPASLPDGQDAAFRDTGAAIIDGRGVVGDGLGGEVRGESKLQAG